MKIGIANDHAGYDLKIKVLNHVRNKGYQVEDFGSNSNDPVDYADYAHPLAEAVFKGTCDLGIILCGSGNGVNMVVNRHKGVRGALCWCPEVSALARAHNNANVCSIPSRFVSEETAYCIVDEFLRTTFDGGRHQRRIDKIDCQQKPTGAF